MGSMVPGDSPAVARRRVRLALREAREANNFTQGQVAEAMEWSLSKVMRIESGEVSISANDLRPLLAHLRIVDPDRVAELIQDAKVSKQRRDQWWEQTRFREHLTPAMRQLINFELDAATIRYFSMPVLPGVLQTPEYASAILDTWREDLPAEDVEIRLEARLRRRNQLFSRSSLPAIRVLLDESVLYRRVGNANVMLDQLADLLAGIEQERIRVRVLPFAGDARLAVLGSYEVFYLDPDDDPDHAVMYRESITVDEIVDDAVTVRRHHGIFEQQWGVVLDEQTSVAQVRQAMRALQS